MYTVHSYYFAVMCQSLTISWIYPTIVTLLSFYCFGFEYHSFTDMLTYLLALFLSALAGSFFGLSTGSMTSNEQVAILIGNLAITLFNFGAGCLANTGDGMNPVIQFLVWVSPMHYAIEQVFKQVSKGNPAR